MAFCNLQAHHATVRDTRQNKEYGKDLRQNKDYGKDEASECWLLFIVCTILNVKSKSCKSVLKCFTRKCSHDREWECGREKLTCCNERGQQQQEDHDSLHRHHQMMRTPARCSSLNGCRFFPTSTTGLQVGGENSPPAIKERYRALKIQDATSC